MMMFDGKVFAAEIEEKIKQKVAGTERAPKLVTIYDPKDTASRIYTNIKAKKAGELGILFEEIQTSDLTAGQIKSEILKLNKDKTVDGIMVQTPIEGQADLIKLIDPKKDADGLRDDSRFIPATVRAVTAILGLSQISGDKTVAVVGSRGMTGMRVMAQLAAEGYTVWGMDQEDFDSSRLLLADIIISCTGRPGLIKSEMVKEGAVCIDVGYPKGDFEAEVSQKAAFFTPVPGGVGPVTVAMLFANLVDS